MSAQNNTSPISFSGTNRVITYSKKVELAEVFYGSVIKRCEEYLTEVEESGKKASLLMVDRSLLLCENRLKKLQRERENQFYGPLSSDERIEILENDLLSLVDKLRKVKQVLMDEGHENSLEKFLPPRNRFSRMR